MELFSLYKYERLKSVIKKGRCTAITHVLYLRPPLSIESATVSINTKRGAVDKNHKEAMLTSCFNQYFDRIARYIYVRLGDKAEAEDLASEVFLKAYKSLDTFKKREVPMQAWLFKIAHNLLVDHHRKHSKINMIHVEDNLEIDAKSDTMETALVNMEYGKVLEAMDKLTQDQRQVVELRFFGGLTSEEVSNVMDKSNGAIRQMQSHAIKRLRQLLEKNNRPRSK
jgi:RNA polymerase sigma-70 factor (ECF subfamily)